MKITIFSTLSNKIESISQEVKEDIYASFLVFKDPRTPIVPKILIILTIGYFLSPIDLIPDFIPFFGYLDDIIIVPALLFIIKSMINEDIWLEAKQKAIKDLPKLIYIKYFITFIIVMFWIFVIFLIIKLYYYLGIGKILI